MAAGLALTANAIAPVAAAAATRSTVQAATSCSVTATIPVGTAPFGIAANPKTNIAYTANVGGNTVSVISGQTNTVAATIPVGSVPAAVAVNPKTNTAYVANVASGTVSVITC